MPRYGWAAMGSTSSRERLTRLADLASRADVPANELTSEVAGLLVDWPANYPPSMREPFEALLEKSLHELDPGARALLAERFASSAGMPLTVLNALIFDAGRDVQGAILARNADVETPGAHSSKINEKALLVATCAPAGDIAAVLSSHFSIQREIAAAVVADSSAFGLAVLSHGANCSRATFSALAVLSRPEALHEETFTRLATYDRVPEQGARALLQYWRAQTSSEPLSAEIHTESEKGTAPYQNALPCR